jgi:hypothetical protein
VGADEGTNVSARYQQGDNRFIGKIEKAVIEVGSSNAGAAKTAESRDLEEAAAEVEQ